MVAFYDLSRLANRNLYRRKSQIAIEYAYRTREAFPDAWVFWVHAGSAAALENDFRKIAQALRLPRWDEAGTHILKIVYDWLCDEENGRWVMIIDNADDIAVFTAPPPCGPGGSQEPSTEPNLTTPQIRDYLPKSCLGTILITSRAKDVAFELTGNANYYIQLQEMTEEEAMKLLTIKLRGTHTESDKLELIKLLEYMPLAISQAAAYISQRAPLVTISSYIKSLQKGDQNTVTLLNSSMTESHREIRRSHSVIATWHLTFEYVRRFHTSAARLLSLMCLFHWQKIEKSLLVGQYDEYTKGKDKTRIRGAIVRKLWRSIVRTLRSHDYASGKRPKAKTISPTFLDDCVMLINFSLVKVAADGQSFALHRLVQLATHKWLDIHHELELWNKRYILLLGARYPEQDDGHWQECQDLFKHAMRAIDCTPTDEESLYVWLRLMLRMASYFRSIGLYAEAEFFNRFAISYLEKTVGSEHEKTLLGYHQLGSALNLQGKVEESEILWRRAWLGRQKLLGPAHGDTLWSHMSLVSSLEKQGKVEEAEALQEMYRPQFRKDWSVDDILSKIPRHLNLIVRGKYAEAEAIFREILDSKQKPWGEDAIEDIENLADMLAIQSKREEAVSLLQTAMTIHAQSSSADPVAVGATNEKLATVLACHGRYEHAEELFRQLTAEPLDATATTDQRERFARKLECLGAVLAKQGLFAEAETIGKQAVDIAKQVSRAHGSSARNAMHTLAEIMRLMGRYEDALDLYRKSHIQPGIERFRYSDHDDLRWMMEYVDDIREFIKTESVDELCWERWEGDDRPFLLTFFT